MRKQIKKMFSAVVTACLSLGLVFNAGVMTAKADSSSWNFKNSNFKSLGTVSSTVTVDGLTLVATSSKTMSVVADNQTADGTEYTYALALGGGGSTSYRAVKVPVSGSDTIKVVLRSTGSSTRTLVVADSKGNQLGTMSAGSSASLQSYSYSGSSGYVYLYSSGSGINLYKIQVDSKSASSGSEGSSSSGSSSSSSSGASGSVSWNFKDADFKNLGKISSNTTVNNLTLTASSSKTMEVKSDTVTVSGTQYTYALALSGTGSTSSRSVMIPVSGACTIKVVLRSSGSSARTLVITDAKGNQLGTLNAAADASLGTFNYTGSAGNIYLYSSNSGINLYKIQVDGGVSGSSSSSSGSSSGSSTSGSSTSSGSSSSSGSTSSSSSGSQIIVKNGGTTLEAAVKSAKKGTTIVIDGTVKSGAVSLPAGVNISGKNNATIDFSQTSGSSGRGITLSGNGSTIENITVKNAADNGIFISGSNNTLKYVTCCYNKDAGFQVSNGGANNKFYNCTSHHNADAKGENADGFAVKLHSGEGNYFENCIAEYNSDDGWDCYAAHGAVTLVNCQANYNGYCDGIYGDGNGFKMGGVDNKTSGVAAHLDPLNHVLIGCSAKGNYANGFDRNNQSGVVTMKNCTADSNKGKNYNWPLTGKPSALGYEVTFGKAIIQDCVSKNGTNNIKGATLKGTCSGF